MDQQALKKWLKPAAIAALIAFALIAAGFSAGISTTLVFASRAERPVDGWRHTGDITLHFPAHPAKLAHHWCKQINAELTECQLYDSDLPNARLIGVEPIVPPGVFGSFSTTEKAYWHWHKKSKARIFLPGATPERVQFVNTHRGNSYGKTILIWDPEQSRRPIGLPRVVPH